MSFNAPSGPVRRDTALEIQRRNRLWDKYSQFSIFGDFIFVNLVLKFFVTPNNKYLGCFSGHPWPCAELGRSKLFNTQIPRWGATRGLSTFFLSSYTVNKCLIFTHFLRVISPFKMAMPSNEVLSHDPKVRKTVMQFWEGVRSASFQAWATLLSAMSHC